MLGFELMISSKRFEISGETSIWKDYCFENQNHIQIETVLKVKIFFSILIRY